MRAILVTIALSIACFGQGGMMPGPGTVHTVVATPSFTVVQSVGQCDTSGGSTIVFTVGNSYNGVTLNTPVTGHQLVVLTTLYNTLNDVTGVASAPSGSFTLNGSVVANGGQHLRAASLASATASTTSITVTESGSTQKCAELVELTVTGGGTFAYDSQDATGVNQGSTTAWTALSFTPTAGKSVIVFGWGMQIGSGATFTTAGSGYTALNPSAANSVWSTGGVYKLVTSASTSYVPNGVMSISTNSTGTGVAYKAN